MNRVGEYREVRDGDIADACPICADSTRYTVRICLVNTKGK